MITIFKNLYDKTAYYIEVGKALERIKNGKSREKIEEIRAASKIKRDQLKKRLPVVLFSGKFEKRLDSGLIEHSGLVCLDFDKIDVVEMKNKLQADPYIFAVWVSPSGDGLKALVKIADPTKHRAHFEHLISKYSGLDKSGVNVSRACFESYDPDIYINENSRVYTEYIETIYEKQTEIINQYSEIFNNLTKWLHSKGDIFVEGNRSLYVYKLASACCRYGIPMDEAAILIGSQIHTSNEFSQREVDAAIKQAYKANSFGSATFQKNILVEKITKSETVINPPSFDPNAKPIDIIYGTDVLDGFVSLYENGYEKLKGIGVADLDYLYKFKRGELTLISGYGNMGKSTFLNFMILMRILLYGEKFAVFSPESVPAHEYYNEFVEMYYGCDLTPFNNNRPKLEDVIEVYKLISSHLFYIYPEQLSPTPEYMKARFFELIVKEKIDGCIIDPFNQMTNDYSIAGGRDDKYLEAVLGDFKRFAVLNDVYFHIVAHPIRGEKNTDGDYKCPDVFQIAGGSMWNNKIDNILIYHRPYGFTEPNNPAAELHTKKIKRQKSVGKRGVLQFEYDLIKRRFLFGSFDPLALIKNNNTTEDDNPFY